MIRSYLQVFVEAFLEHFVYSLPYFLGFGFWYSDAQNGVMFYISLRYREDTHHKFRQVKAVTKICGNPRDTAVLEASKNGFGYALVCVQNFRSPSLLVS